MTARLLSLSLLTTGAGLVVAGVFLGLGAAAALVAAGVLCIAAELLVDR